MSLLTAGQDITRVRSRPEYMASIIFLMRGKCTNAISIKTLKRAYSEIVAVLQPVVSKNCILEVKEAVHNLHVQIILEPVT